MDWKKPVLLASLGLLGIGVVAALWHGCGDTDGPAAEPGSSASPVPSSSAEPTPPAKLACTGIEPAVASVPAGGEVAFTLRFNDVSGQSKFEWTTSDGYFIDSARQEPAPSVRGYVYGEGFEEDELNPERWVVDEGAARGEIEVGNGTLRIINPGGGAEETAVRVKSRFRLYGDFAAEIAVSVATEGNHGAASLGLLTGPTSLAYVQLSQGPDLLEVNANAQMPDGAWQNPHFVPTTAKQLRLQLARVKDRVFQRYNDGSGWKDVGQPPHLFEHFPGIVVLDSSSLKEKPKSVALIDHFAAAQNLWVTWKAPREVAPGKTFDITAAGCKAIAMIVEAPPQPPPQPAPVKDER